MKKMNAIVINENIIKNKILVIRNEQVMLDKDLATLYNVETRALKQAVKRNIERFPEDFMFELTDDEISLMVSQNVIPSRKYFGGAKPYAFTEQGIAMLSSVLKSKTAISANIAIFRAFSKMRKFLLENATLFRKFSELEQKVWQHDEKIDKILDIIERKNIEPKQGIFYDGEVFDAYFFVIQLIKSAKKNIILIDNYIDETVLTLLNKNQQVDISIYTKNISKQLKLDIEKYNAQYRPIQLLKFNRSHDRFLIIDNVDIYYFGASLKDLGKKWFAFSKFDLNSIEILKKLPAIKFNE